MTDAQAFIAALPSGIKRDVEMGYQSHGDLQPAMAIRHWIEIPGTDRGSGSHWTCDGYASSRQYAGMIAEALHTRFGHAYEVRSLHPFGQSKRPHILDFVPDLETDPAKDQGQQKEVTKDDVMSFSEQWVIQHYGIHESNVQHVRALAANIPDYTRGYTCIVAFSQSGEQVTLHMHNWPGGLSMFSLRYDQTESE